MSDFARHWIAGLVKHTYAMTAILCPTVNCYRRMHGTWAPSGRTLLEKIISAEVIYAEVCSLFN